MWDLSGVVAMGLKKKEGHHAFSPPHILPRVRSIIFLLMNKSQLTIPMPWEFPHDGNNLKHLEHNEASLKQQDSKNKLFDYRDEFQH